MQQIIIERNPANVTDAAIIHVLQASFSSTEEQHDFVFKHAYSENETLNERWGDNRVTFVALDGDLPVGTATVIPSSVSDAFGPVNGIIKGVGVLPEYQRQGIATKLLDAIRSYARENGLFPLELYTRIENQPAIKCYERNGFKLIRLSCTDSASVRLRCWDGECPLSDRELLYGVLEQAANDAFKQREKYERLKARTDSLQKKYNMEHTRLGQIERSRLWRAMTKLKNCRNRIGKVFRKLTFFLKWPFSFLFGPFPAYKSLLRNEQRITDQVSEITGLSRSQVIKKIERSRLFTGVRYSNYYSFRFYELSYREQLKYHVLAQSIALDQAYNSNRQKSNLYSNKVSCSSMLSDYLGRPWAATSGLPYDVFRERFGKESQVFYKPEASFGGIGAQKIDLTPGNMRLAYQKIRQLPSGIIEGIIHQHPEMQKFSLNSVNTLRICTIRTSNPNLPAERDKVHFLYAGMRMGHGTGIVDNMHVGGLVAAIDLSSGKLISDAIDHDCRVYEQHPDTGVQIKGFCIPYFKEALQMIEKILTENDIEGYFGWDIAIAENGPVLVELNTKPAAEILQMPYVPLRQGMRYVIEPYLPKDFSISEVLFNDRKKRSQKKKNHTKPGA